MMETPQVDTQFPEGRGAREITDDIHVRLPAWIIQRIKAEARRHERKISGQLKLTILAGFTAMGIDTDEAA